MNRERLFKHLEDHYIPKREMISRIPLDVQPDEFWQDVLNRRRSRSISLQLHNPRGIPYWYVVTNKMIAASEQVVAEMLENETDFDPYRDTPSASSLEESFFTSYVEGSQISLQAAMEFLQGEREPQEPEEQMIINNRNALSFAGANLFRPVDEEYIKTLAYILTENMDGGGQELRLDDCPPIPSMMGVPYELPTASTLPDRVNEICLYLHDPTVHPLIKSGIAQAWVLVTRPFPEGNERLARLLSQVILFRAGYVFFSEISLSSLIARTSYAYFNAISNILLPENGADLTYFLEYYMTLLAKGVEERHQRIKQRAAQEIQAEQVMAQMPLAPQPPQQIQMQMNDDRWEEPPFEPDIPGEPEPDEGGDESIDWNIVKQNLKTLGKGQSERIAQCAKILMNYIEQGKLTFTVADISQSMKIDVDTAGNVITQLRIKGVVESLHRKGRIMIYSFRGEEVTPYDGIRARRSFRRSLLRLSENKNTAIGKSADLLLRYLDKGKNSFYTSELQQDLGITNDQAYKLCYQLKDRDLIILISRNGEHPNYALGYSENPLLNHTQPKSKIEYSQAVLDKIKTLGDSVRSSKDRRPGIMPTERLSHGMVTFQDYKDAGYENSWSKDMNLAQQLGMVEKQNSGCYLILRELPDGLPKLKAKQKEVASLIYNSFGDEEFSSDMVIATLDYTKPHACAILHQFTLLKVLQCSTDSPDKFTYQFLVNPREHPECFSDVA